METTQKRVTPSGNETKTLSTLDKTENGSTRVDTSVPAVPMNMSKPNKTRVEKFPLTPPEEKRSVSFDPSVTTMSVPSDIFSNGFANSPVESIDISVSDCSEEICVSLKERDTEMKDLFDRNKEFFDTIKQSIFEDEKRWEEFLQVLYSKREVIPDSKWIEFISESFSDNPSFISSFKRITGYLDDDNDIDYNDFEEENDDDYYHTSGSCMINEPVYVDIAPIRNFPYVLENLEKSYPQFFINAKNELGKLVKERSRRGSTLGRNHLSNDNPLLHPNGEDQSSDQSSDEDGSSETRYDELKRILVTPRDDMDDVEWETAIYECLDTWPQLVEQFEEIIIQEIRQKTFEE